MLEDLTERQRIARQIHQQRHWEDHWVVYTKSRTANEYIYEFEGLEMFFWFTRNLGIGNTVLDIGAGTTRAISQLSQMDFADGLNFLATNLTRHPEIEQFLGYQRTRITSAERLRGIERESIGGILSVKSITYSIAPKLVVERMDDVLVPGGIIKASLGSRFIQCPSMSKDLVPYLKNLEYDLAVLRDAEHETEQLVAIKPGGKSTHLTAWELLQEDYENLYQRTL